MNDVILTDEGKNVDVLHDWLRAERSARLLSDVIASHNVSDRYSRCQDDLH